MSPPTSEDVPFFAAVSEAASSLDRALFAYSSPEGAHCFVAPYSFEQGQQHLSQDFFYAPGFYSQEPERGLDEWMGFSLPFSGSISGARCSEALAPALYWEKLSAEGVSDRRAWDKLCEEIEKEIAAGILKKAVPSRKKTFSLSPEQAKKIRTALFQIIVAKSAPNTHKFLIKQNESIFFGATPEILYRRQGDSLFVPAIAGTRVISDFDSEELAAEDLVGSEKEHREHMAVVEGICSSLERLKLYPQVLGKKCVKRYGNILHLHSTITSQISSTVANDQLIAALHPTPAIGGFPQKVAMAFLKEHESWRRGLFASPILIKRREEETCLVAIRSGVLHKEQITFFAGAGFVSGSTKEGEWQETEKKMKNLYSLFFSNGGDE